MQQKYNETSDDKYKTCSTHISFQLIFHRSNMEKTVSITWIKLYKGLYPNLHLQSLFKQERLILV